MKTQDILKSLLNAFLIYSMAIFISCASQETVDQSAELESQTSSEVAELDDEDEIGLLEEDDEEADDETADADLDDEDEEELAALEDELADGDDEEELADGELEDEGDEEELADAEFDDEEGLEGEDDEELADAELDDEEFDEDDAELADAELDEEGDEDEAELADAELDEEEGDELDGEELAALDSDVDSQGGGEIMDSASELSDEPAPTPQVEAPSAASEDTFAFGGDVAEPEVSDTDTGFFDAPGEGVAAAPRTVISQTPQVPTQAIEQNGALLNRYYFVRQGDTPESVSELLYGTADRSGELVAWNSGSWRAGKVVYYNSPSDASDYQMRSFYQEKGITPEPHVIQAGEWLSTIAESKYGNIRSWKEIAVLNGLDSPDSISNGQELALYPADLSLFAGQQFAQADTTPTDVPPPSDQMVDPNQNQAQADALAPPVEGTDMAQAPGAQQAAPSADTFSPPPPPVAKKAPIKRRKKSSTGRLIQKNLFSFAVGGVIVFLLLSLLVINRKKRAAANDDAFHDDDDTYGQNKANG